MQRGTALKSPAHLLRLATNAFEVSAIAVHGDADGGDTNKQEATLRAELEQRQLEPVSSPIAGPGEPSHSSASVELSANVLCVKAVIAAQHTLCCAGLADGSLVVAGTLLSKWSVKQTAHVNNAGGILCIDCRQTSISTIEIACGTMVNILSITENLEKNTFDTNLKRNRQLDSLVYVMLSRVCRTDP